MNNTSNIGENNTGSVNPTNIGSVQGMGPLPIPSANPQPINVMPQPIQPITPGQPVAPINTQNVVSSPMNIPTQPVQNLVNNQVPGQSPAILGGVNPQPVQQPIPVNPTPVNPMPVNPMPVMPTPVQPSAPVQAPVQSVATSNPSVNTNVQPINTVPTNNVPMSPTNTEPMPMIPNVDDLIAQAPVQPAVPVAPQMSQPTLTPQDSKVELNMNDSVKIDISPKKEKKKEKVKKVTNQFDDEYEEYAHSNKAPLVMAIIFVGMLVVAFVYYFVIMTPSKVFDKAIDTTIDYFKEFLTGVEGSEKKMKFDLGFVLNTDQDEFKDDTKNYKQKPIDYIKDDYLRGIIYFDSKNQDTRVQLKSYKRLDNFKEIKYNGKAVMNEDGTISDENLKKLIEEGRTTGENKINSQFIKSEKDKENYTEMLDFSFYSVRVKDETTKKDINDIFIGPIRYIDYNNLDSYAKDYAKAEGKQVEDSKIERIEANNVISGLRTVLFDKVFSKIDENGDMDENLKELLDKVNENANLELSYDTVDSVAKIIVAIKDKITEKIDPDHNEEDAKIIDRHIVTKKIDRTTTVALKAHIKVNKDKITQLYKDIFTEFKEGVVHVKPANGEEYDIDVLQEFSNILGVDKDLIKKNLFEEYLLKRDIVTDSVEVNLYMNLANDDLIALDVCVDNRYYFEINSLNGKFRINIATAKTKTITEEGKEKSVAVSDVRNAKTPKNLDIVAVYDRSNGILNGRGFIDNEKTFLCVTFKYQREVDSAGKKIGNKLTLGFYRNPEIAKETDEEIYDLMSDENIKKIINGGDGLKVKPFSLLRCDLTVYDEDDVDDLDEATKKKQIEELNFDLSEEVRHVKKGDNDKQAVAVAYNDIGKYTTGYYKTQITNTFLDHFKDHIVYLVEHLLHNREDMWDESSDGKNSETKKTETKVVETKSEETKIEETKTDTKKEEEKKNTDENKSTEENKTTTSNEKVNVKTEENKSDSSKDETAETK